MIFRKLEFTDFGQILENEQRTFMSKDDMFDLEELNKLKETKSFNGFVAINENTKEIIGHILFWLYGYLEEPNELDLYIATCCVVPEYQKNGIGNELLTLAIETYDRKGYVYTHVAKNNYAGKCLLRKHGFEVDTKATTMHDYETMIFFINGENNDRT